MRRSTTYGTASLQARHLAPAETGHTFAWLTLRSAMTSARAPADLRIAGEVRAPAGATSTRAPLSRRRCRRCPRLRPAGATVRALVADVVHDARRARRARPARASAMDRVPKRGRETEAGASRRRRELSWAPMATRTSTTRGASDAWNLHATLRRGSR